ncbi:MFS family permease [Natronocella acetinitrilica]|uniref:MFS family permease n=1 Tax=Natronocella acetinitrilica TaxID=414046 RepID=A0AAE3G7X4_9GAMM|nr:MFS transporter [Natronocella acetinitrilica]MCP1676679.1 MFS family permease [Natronocella acetinitrilica]
MRERLIIRPWVGGALFGFIAAYASGFGQTFFIGFAGAPLQAQHGLSDGQFGLIYGLATLASGLLMAWAGGLADRINAKPLAVAIVCTLAAGCVLVSLSGGLLALLLGFFLLRFGGQGMLGHLAVVVAARSGSAHRGRAVSFATLGFPAAEATLPLAASLVLMALAVWQGVWWLGALVLLLVALPLLLWVPLPSSARPSAQTGREESAWTRRALIANPAFLRLLPLICAPPIIVTALFFHAGAVSREFDWSQLHLGVGLSVFALGQVAGMLLGGRLVDRFSGYRLLGAFLLPMLVGLLALGLLDGGTARWAYFIGMGVSAGLNAVLAGVIWVEAFGTASLGTVRGLYASIMVVCTAAAPVLVGLLLDVGLGVSGVALLFAAYVLAVTVTLGWPLCLRGVEASAVR